MKNITLVLLLVALGFTGCAQTPTAHVAATSNEAVDHALHSLYDGIRSETLPNGLRVYLKPVPGCPVVTVQVAYHVGSADEELAHTGLSHYLEHLMFKGTDKLMPGDIDRMTLRNGGANNAYTDNDCTVYHFDFAAGLWEQALIIEADRMRNLRIDERHEFEKEKGAVIAELRKNEDEPWDLEYKAILPLLFADGPYGHPVIGEAQHVRDATAEVIKNHYDRWYHPNNAALVIVGGFDPDAAMVKIKALLGPIPKAVLPPRREAKVVTRGEPARKEIASKFAQPRLVMGFNGVVLGQPDDFALDIITQVLSGGKTGRLYRKLVEELEIASDVGSTNFAGRYPGWFGIDVELLPDQKLAQAEELVVAELERLAKEPLDEGELTRARRQIAASQIFSHEDVHSLADGIASGAVVGQPDYARSYLANVVKVTAADVQRTARTLLDPSKRAVIWSLPGGEKQAAKGLESRVRRLDSVQSPESGAGSLQSRNRTTVIAKKDRAARLRTPDSGRGTSPAGLRTPDSNPSTFDLHRSTRHVLPNGLVVILLENHRLPIVVASAEVAHIQMLEPEAKLGVAELTGRLLSEGAGIRTGEQVSADIEAVGGALSMYSDGGAVKTLSPDRGMALQLLIDCLTKPTFAPDAFDREKTRLLADIDDNEFEADALASRTFRQLAYGPHPNARPHLGTDKSVGPLTREDCIAFHASAFAPDSTVLTIAGDFDTETVLNEVTALTAGWQPRKINPPAPADPPLPAQREERFITMADSAQLQLLIGHAGIRRGNPDYYRLLVLDYIFGKGAGFTDRLSSRLRDRQGLAYSVSGSIASSAAIEPGLFICSIGTEAQNLAQARDQIIEEINRLRDEPPTGQEVEDVKAYLLGSQAFSMTTTSEAASMLQMIERYKLGENYLEDYRKAITAVTPADVQAMAKKYLHPDKLVIVAVGAINAKGEALEK